MTQKNDVIPYVGNERFTYSETQFDSSPVRAGNFHLASVALIDTSWDCDTAHYLAGWAATFSEVG